MTELNQQEQDVMDLLTLHKVMTAAHLTQDLGWRTTRLHPIMAALREKGLVKSTTDKDYPHTTVYSLVEKKK